MADGDALLEAFVRLRAKAADGFEGEARESILPGVQRLATDAAAVFAATKIFDIGKQGLDELKDAEAVTAQTASAIKATGGAAGVTADQVADLAGSLSDLSGKDDELIQKGENLLLTFKGVKNEVGDGNDVFDRATKAALDLSVSGFGSMESASLQLGKALNDPIAGMSALSRSGVTFTESQKATIKSLVDTGHTLDAQKLILEEVEHQVGGAAAAYGDTLPGKLERAQTAMDNAKGAMVGGLAPAIELGATLATDLATRFQELPEPLQEVVGGIALVGGGIGALARPVSDIYNLMSKLKEAHEAAAVAAEVQAAAEADVSVSLATEEVALARSGAAFGPWGIAVAAGIVTAAAAWDIWGGKVEHNLDDISDLIGKTGKELADAFLFTKFEGNPEDAGKMLAALARGGEAGVGALKLLRTELQAEGRDVTEVDAALQSAVIAQENQNVATEAGTGVLRTSKEALEDQAQAVSDLGKAYQSLIDGTLSTFEAELRLSDARIASRKAVEDLTKARREGKLTDDAGLKLTNDTFEAILNEAKANEDLAVSLATGKTETEKAQIAQQALVSELYSVASTLDPSSDLHQRLVEYITKLQTVPSDVSTTFNLDTSEAVRAVQDLQRQLAGIAPGANVDIDFYGNKPGEAKALGGDVFAGQSVRTSEFGDEMLLLSGGPGVRRMPGDGTILTAPQTAQVLAGVGGGDRFEQHLHFHGDVDPAKAARRAAREHVITVSRRRR